MVDGKWNVTMNTPMGAQQGVLDLKTEGDALTGTMTGQQGAMELQNGKVDGDTVSWTADLTQPMPVKLEFTGKIEGDKIAGDVVLGPFGKSTFEGTRA